MSIDDSSAKVTRNGEPINVYLHWQRMLKAVSSSSADQHPLHKSLNMSLILSACLPITQWPVITATVIEMTSRPRPSIWLVLLLSIKGWVSLAAEQNTSLTQYKLASWKNFRSMSNLVEVNGILNSIEEDSGWRVPALPSLTALQHFGILLCPGTYISMTLLKRPERGSRQRRHSLTSLEFFTKPDSDLAAVRGAEKIETSVKAVS